MRHLKRTRLSRRLCALKDVLSPRESVTRAMVYDPPITYYGVVYGLTGTISRDSFDLMTKLNIHTHQGTLIISTLCFT